MNITNIIKEFLPDADIYMCMLSYIITRNNKEEHIIDNEICDIHFKDAAIMEATENGMGKDSQYMISSDGKLFLELEKSCMDNLIRYKILNKNKLFIYINTGDGEILSTISVTNKTLSFYKSFSKQAMKLEKVKNLWWLKNNK